MSKRKKRNRSPSDHTTTYSGFTINQNKTMGPDASYEETVADYRDSTTSSNLGEEEPENYSRTTAGLTEKYLLSGKYDVPIWRVAFVLLAAASMWVFIQDNSAGSFKPGDWWSLVWSIQKCAMLWAFIVLVLLFHSMTNWIRKRMKKT